MSLGIVALLVTVVVSMMAVRVGAVALELTGLEHSVARFQALSAFTGTGFTTREAEEVVGHPQRRRIVSLLILVGNAGLAAMIASLVYSFAEPQAAALALLQVTAVLLLLYLLYQLLIWPRLSQRIDQAIMHQLQQRTQLTSAQIQELLQQSEGWGIARVEVPEGCRFAGQPLAETRPRDHGLLIVAIEREEQLIPSPKGTDSVQVGDRLVVYAQLDQLPDLLREQIRPPAAPSPT